MLTQFLSRYFSATIRKRGNGYFRGGAVTLESVHRDEVSALVEGSETYEVSLECDWSGTKLSIEAFCTCPYGGLCKHIWSVLLSLDNHQAFDDARTGIIQFLGYFDDDPDLDSELRLLMDRRARQTPREVKEAGSKTPGKNQFGGRPKPSRPPPPPAWMNTLSQLRHTYVYATNPSPIVSRVEPHYVLDGGKVDRHTPGEMLISLAQGRAGQEKGGLKSLSLDLEAVLRLPNPLDRRICQLLFTATEVASRTGYSSSHYSYSGSYRRSLSAARIAPAAREELLDLLFQTGRFYYTILPQDRPAPLECDNGPAWELVLTFKQGLKGAHRGELMLRRGDESIAPTGEMIYYGSPAYLVRRGKLARVELHGCEKWLPSPHSKPSTFDVTGEHRDAFVEQVLAVGSIPTVDWPTDWEIKSASADPPQPELYLTLPEGARGAQRADVRLQFVYPNKTVAESSREKCMFDPQSRVFLRRNLAAEDRCRGRLEELGIERDSYGSLRVTAKRVPVLVATLLIEGWSIRGNDKLFRNHGEIKFNVVSGIDWFDVQGGVTYGDQTAEFGELLAALKRGEKYVRLGDGSLGVLPEEWLSRHGVMLGLAEKSDAGLRFRKTQITVLDVLLSEMPEADIDAGMRQARKRLREFDGVRPCEPAAEFRGTLRPYQSEGLGWLRFLREFGWGGCLADDMGLGKTVQMLGYLQHRKTEAGKKAKPSLVVVPRSLIFNWKHEAASFAPNLRVLDFSDSDRAARAADIAGHDLVLTTYGTLRRDVESLRKIDFDCVILDEAQAIKNPTALSAKAVRLLQAEHRLAMTGTPIENSLQDLWSIFEFLNPGLLGGLPVFKAGMNGDAPETRSLLHRLLRPFILRRTKQQVARDLPERTEQTIECEMAAEQKKLYAGIREHYRQSLLKTVEEKGFERSKIHVLEALLRLRQAACHPGLIDAKRRAAESAKLETLFPMLEEATSEGHKALVFSQFTEFLAIVRERLDAQKVVYEYLDGQTRDRQERVQRFQTDPKCRLFLISLKAGGVGLNLTAADYVFILDPWWNPAVEAQAIDRTHRIGQTRSVMAYRLVVRDSVESKILELQQQKRGLADAIITADNSVIRNLSRGDLELLLS